VLLGPLRLNLSKSGLGASVGVRGARIGIGPPTALRSAFSSKKARSKKRGRVPRLVHDFVAFAGRLWHEATQSGQARVSNDQLAQIALKLDEKGYMPPADYLEGRAAKELKNVQYS